MELGLQVGVEFDKSSDKINNPQHCAFALSFVEYPKAENSYFTISQNGVIPDRGYPGICVSNVGVE